MLAGWGLAVALAGSPDVAAATSAEDPAAVDGARQRASVKVLVEPDAPDGLLDALRAASTRLRRDGVDLEPVVLPEDVAADRSTARSVMDDASAHGVFWLDSTDPAQMGVFLVAADGSTFVRRVPVDPSSAQAGLEAVWLIVESSALALAVGTTPSMERLVLEPPEPQPEPQPSPRSSPPSTRPKPAPTPRETQPRVRPGITAAYFGESFATNVPWQSGATVGVELDVGRWLRAGIDYAFVSPWPVGNPAVTWRHGPTVHGGVRLDFGDRFELVPRLTAGADFVHWIGGDGSGGIRAMATVGADLVLGVRLIDGLFVVIAPGAAVVLNRFAFIECEADTATCEGAQRRVRTEPWPARPRTRLGLAYRF